MQPPMFSRSFSYSRFMAGGSPVLLGLLLRRCRYCPVSPPRPSLFSSAQAAHPITRAGKGEAASFGTRRSPSVILKSTQSQWSVLKRFLLGKEHPSPCQILLPAPSLPSAPTATWGKMTRIIRLRR